MKKILILLIVVMAGCMQPHTPAPFKLTLFDRVQGTRDIIQRLNIKSAWEDSPGYHGIEITANHVRFFTPFDTLEGHATFGDNLILVDMDGGGQTTIKVNNVDVNECLDMYANIDGTEVYMVQGSNPRNNVNQSTHCKYL